jgi:hypothetical protein
VFDEEQHIEASEQDGVDREEAHAIRPFA